MSNTFLTQLAHINRSTVRNMHFLLESYCNTLLELLHSCKEQDMAQHPSYWELMHETQNILQTLQTYTKENTHENH